MFIYLNNLQSKTFVILTPSLQVDMNIFSLSDDTVVQQYNACPILVRTDAHIKLQEDERKRINS